MRSRRRDACRPSPIQRQSLVGLSYQSTLLAPLPNHTARIALPSALPSPSRGRHLCLPSHAGRMLLLRTVSSIVTARLAPARLSLPDSIHLPPTSPLPYFLTFAHLQQTFSERPSNIPHPGSFDRVIPRLLDPYASLSSICYVWKTLRSCPTPGLPHVTGRRPPQAQRATSLSCPGQVTVRAGRGLDKSPHDHYLILLNWNHKTWPARDCTHYVSPALLQVLLVAAQGWRRLTRHFYFSTIACPQAKLNRQRHIATCVACTNRVRTRYDTYIQTIQCPWIRARDSRSESRDAIL